MGVAGVRAALIDHLSARLDDLDETIEMVRAAFSEEYDDPDDVFRIVQIDWKSEMPNPAKLRQRRFSVSTHQLQLWLRHIASLADIAERYRMYARFADIEDSFEPFEDEAIELYDAIERAVQHAIDLERGK